MESASKKVGILRAESHRIDLSQIKPHNVVRTDNEMPVEVKIINPNVKMPAYQSEMAAGIDLVAAIDEPIILHPGDQVMIPSGIAVSIRRRNVVAFIFPRSSMGKSGFALANTVGVIDADYQGEIAMLAVNRNVAAHGRKTIIIEPGQRIAQLVFMPIIVANLVQVDSFSAATERGAGGFGSTGEK